VLFRPYKGHQGRRPDETGCQNISIISIISIEPPAAIWDEVGGCWPPEAREAAPRHRSAHPRRAPQPIRMPSGSRPVPSRASFRAGTVEGIALNNGIVVAEMIRSGRIGALPRSQVAMRTTSAATCVIWERASILSVIIPRQETPKRRICGMITHLARQYAAYPGPEIPPDPDPGGSR